MSLSHQFSCFSCFFRGSFFFWFSCGLGSVGLNIDEEFVGSPKTAIKPKAPRKNQIKIKEIEVTD
jgi:hypothetical protein